MDGCTPGVKFDMRKRDWLVISQDSPQIQVLYTSMFPETAAEFWGRDLLKPGEKSIVVVFEDGRISPRYCCTIDHDTDRVWVKRTSVE